MDALARRSGRLANPLGRWLPIEEYLGRLRRPNRRGVSASERQSHVLAFAPVAEAHGRGRCNDGEVALSADQLLKRDAGAGLGGGKPDLGEDLTCADRRGEIRHEKL